MINIMVTISTILGRGNRASFVSSNIDDDDDEGAADAADNDDDGYYDEKW